MKDDKRRRMALKMKTFELASQAHSTMIDKINKAFDSGCIDIDYYDDDSYELPKIVLAAVMQDIADECKPSTEERVKEMENIRMFL